MSIITKKIRKFIEDPYVRFYCLDCMGFYKNLNDEAYLRKKFALRLGYELNMEDPRSFNEKMQWLKINDRNEIYTRLVDKYLVKQWVGEILGDVQIIPTIGVWDNPEDINFEDLPEQFVLKCNHNSGEGMFICKDRSRINIRDIRKRLKRAMKKDYYLNGREWPYKNVKRKIIAEKYMDDGTGQLKDYKLFVFEGKVKYIQVDYDRFTNHRRNFYDLNWNYVPFTTCYPTDPEYKIDKPECLEQLISDAEKIAVSLMNPHFIRVDFYIINGKIYFGEITFYHGSGNEIFSPVEWDYKLGELINL